MKINNICFTASNNFSKQNTKSFQMNNSQPLTDTVEFKSKNTVPFGAAINPKNISKTADDVTTQAKRIAEELAEELAELEEREAAKQYDNSLMILTTGNY